MEFTKSNETIGTLTRAVRPTTKIWTNSLRRLESLKLLGAFSHDTDTMFKKIKMQCPKSTSCLELKNETKQNKKISVQIDVCCLTAFHSWDRGIGLLYEFHESKYPTLTEGLGAHTHIHKSLSVNSGRLRKELRSVQSSFRWKTSENQCLTKYGTEEDTFHLICSKISGAI